MTEEQQDFTISCIVDPSMQDIEYVKQNIAVFNKPSIGVRPYKRLGIFALDENGNRVGGLICELSWDWLHIVELWVRDDFRNRGIATQLMERAETEAIQNDCLHAYLDTFSWQALPFYEQLGYEVFGELDDFPKGHKRYFLKKELGKAAQ